MTLPLTHGYPDFGRQAGVQDVILRNDNAANIAAISTIGPLFTGVMPYITVAYQAFTNRGRITFNWYADQALTQFISTDRIVTAAGCSFDGAIPVAGPWLQVQREASAYPDQINCRISMTVGPRMPLDTVNFGPTLILAEAQAVGIGATVTLSAIQTMPGPAMWCIDTALATWTAFLRTQDFGAANNYVASIRNTSLPGPRMVMLNPEPARIAFTNTTAAAGTFNASLIVQSLNG